VTGKARAFARRLLGRAPDGGVPQTVIEELAGAEQRWREQLLPLVGRAAPYLGVELDGSIVFFSTRDAKLARRLFARPDLRRDTIHLRRALAALTAAGLPEARGTFVDVGAHIGTTSLAAVLQHGFARAVAIEPAPENFLLLRLNVVANGLEDAVHPLEAFASATEGIAELDVGAPSSELHGVVPEGAAGRRIHRARMTTLDALAADGTIDPEDVGLLWIDVEGHELDVLDGASALLDRGVPVAMEMCPEKLARAGRLEDAPRLIESRYTHVLDLRRPVAAGPELVEAREVRRLLERYAGHCFELLACRLP
jgi:FkbM family methyltransferase